MLNFDSFKLMPVQDIHILVEESALVSDSYVEWQTLCEEMPHQF